MLLNIDLNKNLFFSTFNTDDIILQIYFSNYTNGKYKEEHSTRYFIIFPIQIFFECILKEYEKFNINFNKEHYLEFSTFPNSYNEMVYTNWNTLPLKMYENAVLVDIGSLRFIRQCNNEHFIKNYTYFSGCFSSLKFNLWIKYNDIYMKINATLGFSDRDVIYKIRFYPKKLKNKPITLRSSSLSVLDLSEPLFSLDSFKKIICDIEKEISEYLY